jgi:hypothetical protein
MPDLTATPAEYKGAPPILPPHLGKIILNSDTTPRSDEDGGLSIPDYVSLNHLYACSVKDGVLAVASTTRYRQKYMTTVFYKPAFTE